MLVYQRHLNVQRLFLYIRLEKHSIRQYYEENEERKTIRNLHVLVVWFILASTNTFLAAINNINKKTVTSDLFKLLGEVAWLKPASDLHYRNFPRNYLIISEQVFSFFLFSIASETLAFGIWKIKL